MSSRGLLLHFYRQSRYLIQSMRGGQHYVPRFLCSPVPMFPGTYVPRYLCSPAVASRRTRGPIDNISFGAPIWPVTNHGMVFRFRMICPLRVFRCHELSLPLNRVCTGQSSDSERARDQWQCAAVTPQVNLSFSFVSSISKHLIECIAIESS